jgi:hypothetical protein
MWGSLGAVASTLEILSLMRRDADLVTIWRLRPIVLPFLTTTTRLYHRDAQLKSGTALHRTQKLVTIFSSSSSTIWHDEKRSGAASNLRFASARLCWTLYMHSNRALAQPPVVGSTGRHPKPSAHPSRDRRMTIKRVRTLGTDPDSVPHLSLDTSVCTP